MSISPWLWVLFTVAAAGAQTLRNIMQRELIAKLGTVGATHVRFLFGLPFAAIFLLIALVLTGKTLIWPNSTTWAWTLLGALAQIAATALMLAAMKERSFVVTTALIKIEPVWVALFGLVFLGDHLTWPLSMAILVATTGVMIMSWPAPQRAKGQPVSADEPASSMRPALLGILAGMTFGVAAIGYRGGILEMMRAYPGQGVVVSATTVLVAGLVAQTVLLTLYLALRDRERLIAIFRAWRPSMLAGFMGAFASQFWFLAFAVESAARVRTLALIEILFAQIVSRTFLKQGLASRDALGIALVVAGVIWLLNP